MYTHRNFKTKKELVEDVKAGKRVTVYQPFTGDFFPTPENGDITIEGPHYPEPHRWYARATLKDGLVVKVC